ncbi:JAB domain-containing protein [Thiorhodovibrio frisius]|uniref:DNA repair protein n=1 Tax=Thiorhodovibrio frisius TaxID=631362 RepID=H8YW12_9GAMM|nr:JAB domain-containing protein [Thiorhodovibrio frisius]EIC23803.1 DNA repair protein [Thiorhodovibrio frisius]WPL23188.1 DNA repair protein RadC [Thiorhodovibrio frisius]
MSQSNHPPSLKRVTKQRRLTNRFADMQAVDLTPDEQDTLVALALKVLEPKVSYDTFTDAAATMEYMQLRFAGKQREVFAVAFLDNRHRLIALEEVFQGTIDGCNVYPRVIAQRGLALNCAACLLVHNHPSGNPTPSPADLRVTRRIKDALDLFEITVLDHIIVGGEGASSLAQEGQL